MHIIKIFFLSLSLSITQIVDIISPRPGDILQGQVVISVIIEDTEYLTAEVEFCYSADDMQTWFLIAQYNQSIPSRAPIIWDTTRISDGDYNLRLRVLLPDQSVVVALVSGVKVRNYTLEYPTPPIRGSTLDVPAEATPHVAILSSTQQASNSAALSKRNIATSVKGGILLAVVIFLSVNLYTSVIKKN